MCGLVGMASTKLTAPCIKGFYEMLYLDVLRGEDSTGVAAISSPFGEQPVVEVFKSVGTPTDFFYDHALKGKARDITNKPVGVFIGHNRFATQGKIDEASAHPFEFPNVVGAHNGTVKQHSLRSFHGFKDYEVDSQIIFSHLSHTQSVDEVWEHADGAMALVWWDKVAKKLNFIRNAQRTLFFAHTEDKKTVIWASEGWMIAVIAIRNHLKMGDLVEVKPNRLYTFSANEQDQMAAEERDLPPFTPKWQWGGYGTKRTDSYDWLFEDDDDFKTEVSKTEMRKTEPVVIKEVHSKAPAGPFAMGFTKDGKTVKINFPPSKLEEATNKIVGRGTVKGYYLVDTLIPSVLQGVDFWADWSRCHYIKLNNDGKVIHKKDNTFVIQYSSNQNQAAPWFGQGHYLLRPAWVNRTSCGCDNCKRIPRWEENKDLFWVNPDMFLCTDCKNIPTVYDFYTQLQKEA